MKKIKLGIWGLGLLLVLVGCSKGTSMNTKNSSSSVKSESTKKVKSENTASSETSSIKETKKDNKILGTLTVQQMKDNPKQSAVAIAYYGAYHSWDSLSGELADGFNVSIETPNASTVKYYVQKGNEPYYRLVGGTHNTVNYYDSSDNRLQKSNMSTIVSFVNKKLSDDARNEIVNNVTIGENEDTQSSKEKTFTYEQAISIKEALGILNNKIFKINDADKKDTPVTILKKGEDNTGEMVYKTMGQVHGTTFTGRLSYEPYGNGGWKITALNTQGITLNTWYMVPDRNSTTVSLKLEAENFDKSVDTTNSTITR
ncbi:hypothetical protein ACVPPR_01390 [Dellaglioa sp. L3N]